MSCEYCTPNKRGKRRPLYIQRFFLKSHGSPKIKKNVTGIYRERNKNKKYFLGTRSWDLSEDEEVTFRNNGFIMKKHINFCPQCGRNLNKSKILKQKEND